MPITGPLLHLSDALTQRIGGGALKSGIDGRVDAQATGGNGYTLLFEALPDEVDEIRSWRGKATVGNGAQRLPPGSVRLRSGDVSLPRHLREHQIPTLSGSLRMPDRIVKRGSVDDRGQRRGFGNGQARSGLAEVVPRRRLDAEPTMPEVDLIEVRL